jgi:hypothetical protein
MHLGVFMQKFMLTTAAFLFTASASVALDAPRTGDFENNQLFLKGIHKNLEFTIEGNQAQGFVDLELRGLVYTYPISETLTAGVEMFGKYYQPTDGYTVGGSYNLVYAVAPATNLYGELEASFGSVNPDVEDTQVALIPKIGIETTFNDTVGGFAEVKYCWNATDNWNGIGGRAEAGLVFAVNDTVAIVPSVVGYFDTEAWSDAQARLGMEFKF